MTFWLKQMVDSWFACLTNVPVERWSRKYFVKTSRYMDIFWGSLEQYCWHRRILCSDTEWYFCCLKHARYYNDKIKPYKKNRKRKDEIFMTASKNPNRANVVISQTFSPFTLKSLNIIALISFNTYFCWSIVYSLSIFCISP